MSDSVIFGIYLIFMAVAIVVAWWAVRDMRARRPSSDVWIVLKARDPAYRRKAVINSAITFVQMVLDDHACSVDCADCGFFSDGCKTLLDAVEFLKRLKENGIDQ